MNAPDGDSAFSQSNYTLEIISEMTGISSETLYEYEEQGLINSGQLDDETILITRRIEQLRLTCEVNLEGVKLILGLMDEVERLRSALRARH